MPPPQALQETIRRHAPQRNQNGDGGRQQKHGEGKRGAEPQPRLHNNSNMLAGIAKNGRILRALRVVIKKRGHSTSSGCSERCGVQGAHKERDENSGDCDSNLQPHFAVLAAHFRDEVCGAFEKLAVKRFFLKDSAIPLMIDCVGAAMT
jgi:hypothetical protein